MHIHTLHTDTSVLPSIKAAAPHAMGRSTPTLHALLSLLALLTRAHAADTPRGDPPAPPALSDVAVGGIVISGVAFLCLCWACVKCAENNKANGNQTNSAFAYCTCCTACTELCVICLRS